MAVELRQLRAVEAVARLCHFTRAGRGTARGPIGAVAPDQPARTPARYAPVRADQPARATDGGRAGDRPPRPARHGRARRRGGRDRRAPRVAAGARQDRRPAPRRRPRRAGHRRPVQPRPPGHRGRAARGPGVRHVGGRDIGRARCCVLLGRRRRPRSGRDPPTQRRRGGRRLRPAPSTASAIGCPRRARTAAADRHASRIRHHERLEVQMAAAGCPLHLALESGDPFLLRSLARAATSRRPSCRDRSPLSRGRRSRCAACGRRSCSRSSSRGGRSATQVPPPGRSSTPCSTGPPAAPSPRWATAATDPRSVRASVDWTGAAVVCHGGATLPTWSVWVAAGMARARRGLWERTCPTSTCSLPQNLNRRAQMLTTDPEQQTRPDQTSSSFVSPQHAC